MFLTERAKLQELMQTTRLPVAYALREHVVAGGLLSYGADLAANFRHAATYVDKILKGAKPARPPRRADDQIRVGHQSEDREGAWRHHSAVGAGARGRGDSVIDRRTFIGSFAIATLVGPRAVSAQSARKVYRIGFLAGASREFQPHLIAAFEAGLRERGYAPGANLVIEYRFADGHFDRLPALATELVGLGVDVIVTGLNPGVFGAKRATATIPIVMAASFFPVEDGLVASLARPGGNLTGFAQETGEEVTKRLQLLREVVPKLTRVATLSGVGMSYNPYFVTTLQDAARGIGVSVLPFEIRNVEDVNQAFVDIERARADGLIVFGGPVTLAHRSPSSDWRPRNSCRLFGVTRSALSMAALCRTVPTWPICIAAPPGTSTES